MTTTDTTTRQSRLWLYLPFALLGVAMVVWTGFWFYARSQIEGAIDGAIAAQAARGGEIRCPERSVSGYPFRLQVRCVAPSLVSVDEGGRLEASLERLDIVARAVDPTSVAVFLDGPLVLRGDGGETRLDWDEARFSARAAGFTLGGLDLVMLGLRAELAAGVAGPVAVEARAERFEAHLRQKDGTVAAGRADYDMLVKANALRSPLLAGGASEPLTIELQSTASKVPLAAEGAPVAMLDAWRDAGGDVEIVLARLDRAGAHVEAKGRISVDAERRPAGAIDLSLKDAGSIAGAFGVEPPGLLRPLLAESRTPITLEGGQARLAGFPIARLPALFGGE
jgi:hypothetical protein